MSFQTAGYQLLPVLPELVLAAGAMVLLMLGAYRGQETTRLVTALAVCLLVVTGVLELMLPAGKLTTFGGSFIVDDFARFLKILALIGSAVTLILSTEFLSDPSRRIFEYSILVLLSTLGMMVLISAGDLIMLYLGLELMSPRALRRRRQQPRQRQIDRSRPEVFCAGRAVLGHAAVWRLADLRLYRHRQLCRHCGGREDRRRRHRVRPRLPARRPLLQGLGRAVPHVDA